MRQQICFYDYGVFYGLHVNYYWHVLALAFYGHCLTDNQKEYHKCCRTCDCQIWEEPRLFEIHARGTTYYPEEYIQKVLVTATTKLSLMQKDQV